MGMIKLIALPLVIFFVLSAFLFVMVEQGIMTWLPRFNHHVLALSDTFERADGQHFGFVAGGGALFGRPVGKKFHWTKLLTVCLLLAMGIVAFVLPRALDYQAAPVHSFGDIPMIGFVFPLIGLFIAPVYPLIASATLSALPQKMHSAMTGLIVIFSALGGTLGSRDYRACCLSMWVARKHFIL